MNISPLVFHLLVSLLALAKYTTKMIVSIETHETKEGGVAEDRREKEC